MVLFNEYDTSRLDNAIQELNNYFCLIDKDFFEDFEKLRETIKEKYEDSYGKFVLRIYGDLAEEYISFDESVRVASEVFESINPNYKEKFLEMVNNSKYEFEYGDKHLTSNNYKISLTGTIDDVLVLVHEFAHNFIFRDYDCFFLSLFDEINAIFWEKVAIDYLDSNYNTYVDYDGIRLSSLINGRTKSLKQFYLDMIAESKDGIDVDGFFKVYKDANMIARMFIDSDLLFSKDGARVFLFGEYNHDLGFLLANVLYQDYLDNPDNIYKLYDIENMNSGDDSSILEGLCTLIEDGIPIIHDGRISLKGDNEERILKSLNDTMIKGSVLTMQ